MINRDSKITFFQYLPYECTAVEEYLEQMAEKGWLLQSAKGFFFKFKKMEPKKIKYSVDVLNKISIFDHKDSCEALEYREYCKAAGWNYVCQVDKIQIFYTENDKETISIHTDEVEKLKSVFKASLYSIGAQFVLILAFVFNIHTLLFIGSLDYTLSSNLCIGSIVLMLSYIIINSVQIISFFIWFIKAKWKLKENKFMPYNTYKQLKIKNILSKVYILIMFLVLLKVIAFTENVDEVFKVFLLSMICIPIIISICVKSFINKKRYSKDTNVAITISSTLLSIFLILAITGGVVVSDIFQNSKNRTPIDKTSLTLIDSGYKKSDNVDPYVKFDKSILAQRLECIYGNGNTSLSYTVLQSQYPLIIKLHKNRLMSRYNEIGNDLRIESTNLPEKIQVYSDSKKRSFVLISKNKVIDIRKDFKNVSEEEFLNNIYKKFFM